MGKHKIVPLNVIARVGRLYVTYASVLLPASGAIMLVAGGLKALVHQLSPAFAQLLILPIQVVGTALVTGLAVLVAAGPPIGTLRLLYTARRLLLRLALVTLVVAFVEGAGLILFVAPGLVLFTVWAVYAPVVVLESPPGFAALSRSRELVRGNGWRVFSVILVLVVIVDIVSAGVVLIGESSGTVIVFVVQVVVSALAIPLAALAAAVLYFELSCWDREVTDRS
jgi:hypothetical protein